MERTTKIYPLVLVLSLALATSALTSCVTTSLTTKSNSDPIEPAPAPSEKPSAVQWDLVSENPSVFFPEGMSKDAPTTFQQGEWVYSQEKGAKWFIPTVGAGSRDALELKRDALTMRTEREKRKLTRRRTVESIAEIGIKSTLTTALFLSCGIAGADPTNVFDNIWRY